MGKRVTVKEKKRPEKRVVEKKKKRRAGQDTVTRAAPRLTKVHDEIKGIGKSATTESRGEKGYSVKNKKKKPSGVREKQGAKWQRETKLKESLSAPTDRNGGEE